MISKAGAGFVFLLFISQIDWIFSLHEGNLPDEWHQYKAKHSKKYKDTKEEMKRYHMYLHHKKMIEEHNKKYDNNEVSFKLKINHFGDMFPHEFERFMNFNMTEDRKPFKTLSEDLRIEGEKISAPQSVDWRTKNAVTPIKNQGQCGSCWAFATVAALESHYIIKYKSTVLLSEQNLVDCSTNLGNAGCSGGRLPSAFEYVKEKGIDTASYYPYKEEEGSCRYDKNYAAVKIDGYYTTNFGDEESLKQVVGTKGPVAVSVDAHPYIFRYYSSGIFYTSECTQDMLSHGVTVVGYGTENGEDYWIIKNSWGEHWGENGYMKLARNKNNHCGVASQTCYPGNVNREKGVDHNNSASSFLATSYVTLVACVLGFVSWNKY